MLRNLLLRQPCSPPPAARCRLPPACGRPLVDVDLVDRDTGQWLPETPHPRRHLGRRPPGHRYAVRLTNTSGERVLVVLSVDGVNAVTGETARPSQAGYVLEPWQSTEIARLAQVDGRHRRSSSSPTCPIQLRRAHRAAAQCRRDRRRGVPRSARRSRYVRSPTRAARLRDERRRATKRRAARGERRAQSRRDGRGRIERATQRSNRSASAPATARANGRRSSAPTSCARRVRPTQVTQLRYDDYDALVVDGRVSAPASAVLARQPRAFPSGFVADPPGG